MSGKNDVHTWILHALITHGPCPTWPAPAVVGLVTPPVVAMAPEPADWFRAIVATPALFALTLHWLVAIAVLFVTAGKGDTDVTVLTSPPRLTTTIKLFGLCQVGTEYTKEKNKEPNTSIVDQTVMAGGTYRHFLLMP